MPIRHSIIHQIDKKPGGSPAVLHVSDTELVESQATENLLNDLNIAYNAKTGKGWGFFHAQSGTFPLSGWLQTFIDGGNFIEFSRTAVEHLTRLMEESNLSVGGHVLFTHYRQGLTDYLVIAMLQQSESVTVNADLSVTPSKHLDFGNIHLAARINL
ncbi:nucleoid-associated protein, partial [Pseudomonas sp. TWR3-1-1]|uniref:nucleoid-associated protein n=1 Tax=Pseudomonas sp. TWR3-1-1 TaxID=2804633 RepID=UPI003CE6A410